MINLKYKYEDVIKYWQEQKLESKEDYMNILENFSVLFAYNSGAIENDKDIYRQIDYSINIDSKKFPKLMQNTMKILEEYDRNGDCIMYDGLALWLESFAKSALLENRITEIEFNQILKKYCE